MTRLALAKTIGVTAQQMHKYERGTNRVSFSRLVHIARALDCYVLDLIGDLDAANPDEAVSSRGDQHLPVKGTSELLTAYAALPPALRKAVLNLLVKVTQHRVTGKTDTVPTGWCPTLGSSGR